MARRAKPNRGRAFGILNPYGDIWTWEVFKTEAAAQKHLADFWKGLEAKTDLSRFQIIPVKVTVSDDRPKALATPAGGEEGR